MIRGFLLAVVRSPLFYLSSLLLVVVIYFSAANPFFGNFSNFKGIGAGAAPLGIIAVGVTIALAAGAIDFSVAGNAALAGVVAGLVAQNAPGALAILAAMGASLLVGLINGIAVTRFRVNAFIATLATAGSARGIAFVLAGSSVGVFINGGPIMGLGQASSLGLPNALWLLLISAGIGFLLLRHTPYGRRLLAVGGNAEAARLAGMPVGLLQLSGYLISALGASIGGILLAGRDGTAIPQAASGTELLIFSAALLGGTSLAGGRASIIGSVLGVLLFNVLYNGFALQSVSPYWQIILQGALLIVAVWLVQQRQQGRDPASVIGQRIRKLVFPR